MQMEHAFPAEIFWTRWTTMEQKHAFPFAQRQDFFPPFSMTFFERTLIDFPVNLMLLAEMALRVGQRKVGLQEDAQNFHDEGT